MSVAARLIVEFIDRLRWRIDRQPQRVHVRMHVRITARMTAARRKARARALVCVRRVCVSDIGDGWQGLRRSSIEISDG